MTKKRKKKSSMSAELRPEFVVIDVDISGEQQIDTTALEIMESLKDCVSKDLFELLKAMLLGFNGDIQLEMADDLLDFTMRQVIHSTGCCSVDVILEACYRWIADEQGIIVKNFKNLKMLIFLFILTELFLC